MKVCSIISIILITVLMSSVLTQAHTLDHEQQKQQTRVTVDNPIATTYFLLNNKWYVATTSFTISVGNPSSHAGIKSNTLASTVRNHQLSITFNTISYGYQNRSNTYTSSAKIGEFTTSTLCGCPYPLDYPNYKYYTGTCTYYYGGSALSTGVVQYY